MLLVVIWLFLQESLMRNAVSKCKVDVAFPKLASNVDAKGHCK